MSAVKMCYVCDAPIMRGEPRLFVDNIAIHEYCSVEAGIVCDNEDCGDWRLAHGGPCW